MYTLVYIILYIILYALLQTANLNLKLVFSSITSGNVAKGILSKIYFFFKYNNTDEVRNFTE